MRRRAYRYIFLIIIAVLLAGPRTATSDQEPIKTENENAAILDSVSFEDFTYSISFWILKNVAIGKVSIIEGEEGEYIATLSAWTTGKINKFILKRKDTHTAHMTLSDDGTRFVTKSFSKLVNIGKREPRRTRYDIDYDKGIITKKSWRGEKLRKTEVTEMKPGVTYYDPITAFYNFRLGALGPIEEGSKFRITTFPKNNKDVSIALRVGTEKEKKKLKSKRKKQAKHYVAMRIDKELLESKSGKIDILFNEAMVPIEAVARDILMFGDVTGRLINIGVPMKLKKRAVRGETEKKRAE